MFDTQTGQHHQYSGLLKKYFVQQISALTGPASAERQNQTLADRDAEKLDLQSRALAEVSDWSGPMNPNHFQLSPAANLPDLVGNPPALQRAAPRQPSGMDGRSADQRAPAA